MPMIGVSEEEMKRDRERLMNLYKKIRILILKF